VPTCMVAKATRKAPTDRAACHTSSALKCLKAWTKGHNARKPRETHRLSQATSFRTRVAVAKCSLRSLFHERPIDLGVFVTILLNGWTMGGGSAGNRRARAGTSSAHE
jgi:hypothetical protein